MAIVFETVGKRIKEIRRQKKMTQDALAEKARLSPQYVSQIETGKKKGSLQTYNKLAKALNVSIGDLTGSDSQSGRVLSDVELILKDCSDDERKLLIELLRAIKNVIRGEFM